MFLSKLAIDRRNWAVVHDLEDRDRLHKKVLKFFPELPGGPRLNARQELGVLFRVEGNAILMQSKTAPRMARLPGYEIVATKNVAANYAAVRLETTYRFRLDANTAVQMADGDPDEWVPETGDTDVKVRRKTKRVGCGNYPARARWFEGMSARFGFTPTTYFMESLSPLRMRDGILEATRFDGHLVVIDRNSFSRALMEGIGQGKAYGLGLLSIRNV